MLQSLRDIPYIATTPSSPPSTAMSACPIVTDVTIHILSSAVPLSSSSCQPDPSIWHLINKDLYQYGSQRSAWMYVALKHEEELVDEDLVVTNIRIGGPPSPTNADPSWESRPGGIWLLRTKISMAMGQAVTGVDVLFGSDAVDPRPRWTLMQLSLQINPLPAIQARLTICRGSIKLGADARVVLRVKEDGKFKIVQISDTHMGIDVGTCNDAIDAYGTYLPDSEADPLTMSLIEKILDAEKPDFVVYTGDQLHHDVTDSQSAIFKVFSPVIKRSIPFAAVFGNHDSEGVHALSRKYLHADNYALLLTDLQVPHRCQYYRIFPIVFANPDPNISMASETSFFRFAPPLRHNAHYRVCIF